MPKACLVGFVLQATLVQSAPYPPNVVPRPFAALYDKQPDQDATGEPIITVGILTDVSRAQVRSAGAVRVTWADSDGTHQRLLQGPMQVEASVQHTEPAALRTIVPLTDDMPAGAAAESNLLQQWALKGVPAFWQPGGALWPQFSAPQDLRRVRGVTVAPSWADGTFLYEHLAETEPSVQPPEIQRLSYPQGTVRLERNGGPLAQAFDLITLEAIDGGAEPNSSAGLEVLNVPYGMGYPWAGQRHRSYRGALHMLVAPSGRLTVVNAVALEQYLRGVVPEEMPPGAPKEALGSQAIAARSHVLQAMGHRHRDMPYHFCAEQHCQVYGGRSSEAPHTDTAVATTRGTVLMAEGAIVRALFSADCGGRTENNDVPWAQTADGPLRSVDDFLKPGGPSWRHTADLQQDLLEPLPSFCGPPHGAAALRPWRRRISCHQLEQMLEPLGDRLGRLVALHLGPRGPGGRLYEVTFEGTQGTVTVRRELPIRKVLGGLPSAAFVLLESHEEPCPPSPRWQEGQMPLNLMGTGWGHGVGLCQRGAMGRARAGQSKERILRHYYRGSRLQRLYPTHLTQAPPTSP